MARGTLTVRILGDASDLKRVLGGVESKLGTWAKRGLLAAGAAVVGGMAASIKAFADFDQAMTTSLAIMGDVSDAMRGRMSDAAREVGRTTKFSASEAAEAYYFLASAGMDAEQAIAALPQVAAFAQAGMFDLSRATDLATDAQSALRMGSQDAAENLANLTRITDVLVGANTVANASVEQFATSLTNRAGAAMVRFGVDLEEGVAALAVFADQGVKGEEAGTRLARTLEGLSDRARASSDDFERLNIRVFDSDGAMRPLVDIIRDMERAFAGMSTEQREAELAKLGFNKQAAAGIDMLLGNSDALADYTGRLGDMGGITDRVANNQMQTFWARLGLIRDQLVDVGISIGSALMPALEAFAGWIESKMPAITRFVDVAAQRFVSFFGDTSSAAQDNAQQLDSWARSAVAEKDRAIEAFRPMPRELRDILLESEPHLRAWVSDMGDAGEDGGSDFMSQMRAALSDLWHSTIVPWWSGTVLPWIDGTLKPWLEDKAYDAGSAMIVAFGKGILASGQGVLQFFFDIGFDGMENLKESLDQGGTEANGLFSAAMTQLAGGGASAWARSWAANEGQILVGPPATAREAAQRAAQQEGSFLAAGRALVAGMGRGMDAARPGIISRARTMVSEALAAARAAAGIRSPSRLFAEQVGRPIVQGVAAGIEQDADVPVRAVQAMLDDMVQAAYRSEASMSAAMSALSAAVGQSAREMVGSLKLTTDEVWRLVDEANRAMEQAAADQQRLMQEQAEAARQMADRWDATYSRLEGTIGAWLLQFYDASKLTGDQLDELAGKAENFANAMAGSFGSATDVVREFGKSDAVSGADLVKWFEDQVAAADSWSKDLRELARTGIDRGLLERIAAAGPEAAGLVRAMLEAVKDGNLEVINQAEHDLQTILDRTVRQVGLQLLPMWEAGHNVGISFWEGATSAIDVNAVQAAQGIAASIRRAGDAAHRELTTIMQHIDRDMAAWGRRLAAANPAAAAVRSWTAAVPSQPVQPVVLPAGPRGSDGAAARPIQVDVTVNNPVPEPTSQSVSRTLRAVASSGVFND